MSNNAMPNQENEIANSYEVSKFRLYTYELTDLNPPYQLVRPGIDKYFVVKDLSSDPAVIGQKEELDLSNLDIAKGILIEASLTAADDYIRTGDLGALKKYYTSWKLVLSEKDVTPHEFKIENIIGTQEEYGRWYPDLFEYLYCIDKAPIQDLIRKSMEETVGKLFERGGTVWIPAVNLKPSMYIEIKPQGGNENTNCRIIRRLVYDDNLGTTIPQECSINLDAAIVKSWILVYLES